MTMSVQKHDRPASGPGREQVLLAAIVYVLLVLAAGFVLGVFRVLILIPWVGMLNATLIELPAMLVVSWFVSLWTCRSFEMGDRLSNRLAMGGLAFAFLMLLEFALAFLVFGRTVEQQLVVYDQLHARLGLLAQIALAFLPAIQLLTDRR